MWAERPMWAAPGLKDDMAPARRSAQSLGRKVLPDVVRPWMKTSRGLELRGGVNDTLGLSMAADFAGVLQREVATSRVVSIGNSPTLSITRLVRRNIDASNPVHWGRKHNDPEGAPKPCLFIRMPVARYCHC